VGCGKGGALESVDGVGKQGRKLEVARASLMEKRDAAVFPAPDADWSIPLHVIGSYPLPPEIVYDHACTLSECFQCQGI
jgi:hypothetical protein